MRLQSIQFGRAIACLLVVIHHLLGLSRDYAQSAYYQPLVSGLKAGVDVFFVISGVVMVITTASRFGEKGTAGRFAAHRLSRIYPPYWVLAILLIVPLIMQPGSINAEHGGVNLITSFTLFPTAQLPIVPVAWTLSFELMFYLIFWLLLLFVSRAAFTAALLIWIAVVLVGNLLRDQLDFIPLYNFMTAPFVLEFIGGCFIGLEVKRGKFLAPMTCIVSSVVLFAVALAWLQIAQMPDSIDVTLHVALFGLPALLFVYGLIGLEKAGRWPRIPSWFILIGDSSYSLYLTHILVIHAAYRIGYHRIFHGFGPIFLPVTFATTLVVGVLYYRIVELPLSRLALRMLDRATARPARTAVV